MDQPHTPQKEPNSWTILVLRMLTLGTLGDSDSSLVANLNIGVDIVKQWQVNYVFFLCGLEGTPCFGDNHIAISNNIGSLVANEDLCLPWPVEVAGQPSLTR